jgi:predicted RNA-binding protein with PUA-like domain
MKADPALADMVMLRQSRLSVAPLTPQQFEHIVALSKA